MRWILSSWGGRTLLALAACWTTCLAYGQVFNSVSYVRELHERYLGRAPSADESAYWTTRLKQGSSPADIHAGIVGSEAFFDQHGRDARSWIRGSYSAVLRREPTTAELDFWFERYEQLDRDRMRWAKEFLRSAGGRLPTNPARTSAAVTPDDAPDRLVTTARLLRQAVESEVPGNAGWLVKLQASNLESAATNGRAALAQPTANSAATQVAYRNIDMGVRGVQDGLANCGFSTPTSRLYLNQLMDIQSALGRSISARPVSPVAPVSNATPGFSPQTYDEFTRRLDRLSRANQQVILQLRGLQVRDYYYGRLSNDLESFAGQIDSVRSNLRYGFDLNTLRAPLTQLRMLSGDISNEIQQGNPDTRVVQSWYEVTVELNGALELVGLNDALRALPPPPTSSPAGPTSNLHADAAAAMAQCDGLITGLAPYAFFSPSVQRMQTQIQSLRNSLDAFRRQISSGDPTAQLQRQLTTIKADYQAAQSLWNQSLADPQLRAVPGLNELKLTIDKLEQSLPRS